MKDANVVMTRTGDTYLTLQQRADIANKSQGDIFISIHTNSVDKKNRNRKNLAGSSVYTLGLHKDDSNLEVAMRENSVIELENDFEQKYSGFDPQRDESYIIFEMAQKQNLSQSIKFAENIEKELVKSGREGRGVHQAGFWVLWATSMPSVLVELDFICNPQSAKYLSSEKGAKELAGAIFKALQTYEKEWGRNRKLKTEKELASTYIEGSDNNLEEVFIETETQEYASARKRVHRPETSSTSVKRNNANGERRRRSQHSKQLSTERSFEQSNLVYNNMRVYTSVAETSDKEEVLVSRVETESPDKGKSKKKKTEPKKKKEEKKSRKKDAHNARVNKLVTVYKIQVLASTDLLNQSSARFCGLTPITAYKENNIYKYYYGESTDKSEMEALLSDVRKKIPDAFIVKSQKTEQKTIQ